MMGFADCMFFSNSPRSLLLILVLFMQSDKMSICGAGRDSSSKICISF